MENGKPGTAHRHGSDGRVAGVLEVPHDGRDGTAAAATANIAGDVGLESCGLPGRDELPSTLCLRRRSGIDDDAGPLDALPWGRHAPPEPRFRRGCRSRGRPSRRDLGEDFVRDGVERRTEGAAQHLTQDLPRFMAGVESRRQWTLDQQIVPEFLPEVGIREVVRLCVGSPWHLLGEDCTGIAQKRRIRRVAIASAACGGGMEDGDGATAVARDKLPGQGSFAGAARAGKVYDPSPRGFANVLCHGLRRCESGPPARTGRCAGTRFRHL